MESGWFSFLDGVKESITFIKKYKALCFQVFLVYFLSHVLANIALYRYVITDPAQVVPLRDLGFDLIPETSSRSLQLVSDGIPVVAMAVSIVFLTFRKNASEKLFIDVLVKGASVFFLNSICQVLTVVPHSETTDCFVVRIASDGDRSDHDHIGWWLITEFNIIDNCSDMMWSGHTAHTLQAFHALNAVLNTNGNEWWLIALFVVVYIVLVTFMISLRYHYTMDIFVATVVVMYAFKDVRPIRYLSEETERLRDVKLNQPDDTKRLLEVNLNRPLRNKRRVADPRVLVRI